MEKSKKKGIVIGVIVLAALFVVFFSIVMPALAEGSYCVAPDGYQLIADKNAITMDGTSHWIARAIVPTGKGNGGVSVKIPGCITTDESLEPFGGVYLLIDGNIIYAETGVWSKSVPLPEAPQQ